jgi:hypothetical protein
MTEVGVLISLLIAGCSLAVAVAGGFVERKRPFALLRLAGMPLASLRRIVMLEAAVPLVLVVAVSVGAGLLASSFMLDATLTLAVGLVAPSWSYCGVMLSGLVAALAVVALTLPLLDRVTAPASTRLE